ncbi:MAG: UbiA family prenyltransferase [Bacteroidales bacterium]|nr:UbiA family prenyltransferase [Bacteroidales bacterium]
MHLPGDIRYVLRLVRWQNLLIAILTMVLMRYALVETLAGGIYVTLAGSPGEAVQMTLRFPWYDFMILVFATVCITAGGYVINDYFDIRTDLINRGEVIIGTRIPRRKAILWHSILNIAGVTAGFYVSAKAGYFWFGTIFLLISGLLYFYSASYKRQFLIGNLLVAVLTALVPVLAVLFEWTGLYRYYSVHAVSMPDLKFLFGWAGGFALFAFLTTFIREIIKDTEDFEGDAAYGRNTLPVVVGIPASKFISVSLIIVTIVLLFLAWLLFINDKITLVYLSVAIVLPLITAVYMLLSGKNRKELHTASGLMKMVMLAGILYSVVVKIIIGCNLI